MIDLVGLSDVARKRAGGFSLGMGQRLGIAAALLGDPATLILDEPVNGLDPEGILWIRNLLKGLAAEGRTVFLSSHLMSEMAQTADHLIVIGRGRLIADTTSRSSSHRPRATRRVACARRRRPSCAPRWRQTRHGHQRRARACSSQRPTSAEIGNAAAGHGIALHELTPQTGLAGGGVHAPDRRRGRVPRRDLRPRDGRETVKEAA